MPSADQPQRKPVATTAVTVASLRATWPVPGVSLMFISSACPVQVQVIDPPAAG
jgi:hypothetical protein